jgi:hypothetical protein
VERREDDGCIQACTLMKILGKSVSKGISRKTRKKCVKYNMKSWGLNENDVRDRGHWRVLVCDQAWIADVHGLLM